MANSDGDAVQWCTRTVTCMSKTNMMFCFLQKHSLAVRNVYRQHGTRSNHGRLKIFDKTL